MADRFPLEGISLTPDEATTLCAYHLRVAAALFEIVPEDRNLTLTKEIQLRFEGHEPFGKMAALMWAQQMLALYDAAERELDG